MFKKDKVESIDHKNLPKPYKPDELQKLNDARQAEAESQKSETKPEEKAE